MVFILKFSLDFGFGDQINFSRSQKHLVQPKAIKTFIVNNDYNTQHKTLLSVF